MISNPSDLLQIKGKEKELFVSDKYGSDETDGVGSVTRSAPLGWSAIFSGGALQHARGGTAGAASRCVYDFKLTTEDGSPVIE